MRVETVLVKGLKDDTFNGFRIEKDAIKPCPVELARQIQRQLPDAIEILGDNMMTNVAGKPITTGMGIGGSGFVTLNEDSD